CGSLRASPCASNDHAGPASKRTPRRRSAALDEAVAWALAAPSARRPKPPASHERWPVVRAPLTVATPQSAKVSPRAAVAPRAARPKRSRRARRMANGRRRSARGGRLREQVGERGEVDVATREEHAHALTGEVDLPMSQRRRAGGARRLEEHLHALEDEAQR